MAFFRKNSLLTLVASLIGSSAQVMAQTDVPCAAVSDAEFNDRIGIARIANVAPRVHFIRSADEDHKDCPSTSPKCRETAYLVPGDIVLTMPQTSRGYVCATYLNRKSVETYGWLPAAALTNVEAKPVDDEGWVGSWRRNEAEIKIKRGQQSLSVEGEATYGAHNPRRVASGAVNTGEFDGVARRTGNVILVADKGIASFESAPNDKCVVRMRRIGPYLLVEDNRACGGMNVSFTGLYGRR